MNKKMVGSLDQTPDVAGWFGKYKGIKKQIDEQLLRGLEEPGKGLTLDQLQKVVEHRNPFPVKSSFFGGSSLQLHEKLAAKTQKILTERFSKPIIVDPFPGWFTLENLEKAAKFNLRPIFLPDEEITQDRPLKKWKKPKSWFYEEIKEDRLTQDSAYLKRGWYLADFSIGVDYTGDIQVFPNDPLAPIIHNLRQADKIGRNTMTPFGSRFAILPQDEWPLVFAELAKELDLEPEKIRLERYIEFNAIGNLYDKNRGQFKIREWFTDSFIFRKWDPRLLYGGHPDCGGLADVDDCRIGDRGGIAGRPLVSFAE